MATKTMDQIIGTLESLKEKPISGKPPKRQWLDKWLCLLTKNDPILKTLEITIGQFCSDIWASPNIGKSLLLYGFNGCGKTHCAKSVKDWLRKVGHGKQWIDCKTLALRHLDVIMWRWPEYLDTLKSGNWDVTQDMIDVSVLILDDIGAGHDPSRMGSDKLCQILSRREEKWTMMTTNVTPENWCEVFDNRIASRFLRNSLIVDLTGVPDFNA